LNFISTSTSISTSSIMSARYSKYRMSNINESMKNKSMWTGSKKKADSKEFVIDLVESNIKMKKYVLRNTKIAYTMAVKQLVTEVIANVLDLKDNTLLLYVNIDNNGMIEVTNTGDGIPIVKHPEYNKYVPEIICSEFSGSNLKTDPLHVSAGTNGVGLKVVMANSKYFELVTSDIIEKKIFKIKFTDNKTVEHPYEIIDHATVIANPSLDETTKKSWTSGFTKVTFLPDYACLDYGANIHHFELDIIKRLIITQLLLIKVYRPNLTVFFNGELIDIPLNDLHLMGAVKKDVTLHDQHIVNFCNILFRETNAFMLQGEVKANAKSKVNINEQRSYFFKFKHTTHSQHSNEIINFDIKVVVTLNKRGSGMNQVLILNGIYASNGGSILDIVTSFFKDNLRDKVMKISQNDNTRSNNATLLSYMNFVIIVDVPTIYMEPSAQIKDKIAVDKQYLNGYIVPKYDQLDDKDKKQLNAIWKEIKTCMEIKVVRDLKVAKVDVSTTVYTKADKSGGNESYKCTIYIPEGESAETLVRNVIPSFQYCGIYRINGVISNALKKSKLDTTVIDDIPKNSQASKCMTKAIYHPDRSLLNDKRIQGLLQVIGLDHKLRYGFDPIGQSNFRKLRYGAICCCNDEDDDGVGNIFPLLTCYINTYWPELFQRGFVKRLITPIYRIIKPSTYSYADEDNLIAEFTDDYGEKEWLSIEDNKAKVEKGQLIIRRYKGLGTHLEEEYPLIAKTFGDRIHTVYHKEEDDELYQIFYGKDVERRKAELLAPLITPPPEYVKWCRDNKVIPTEYNLKYFVKTFQLITITRRLRRALDGLDGARTKVLYTALKRLANKQTFLNTFMGSIIEDSDYHHGEQSLYGVCVGMARKYAGSNVIPLLNPDGNYGDRNSDNASAARYLHTSKPKILELIFPPIDNELLDYEYEDKWVNPKYYVPIVPMSIIESYSPIGTGWNTRVWGRDIISVINNIYRKIQNQPIEVMPIGLYKFKGKLKVTSKGKEAMVGNYNIVKPNLLTITEVPYGRMLVKFIASLEKAYVYNTKEANNVISTIKNHSRGDNVLIKIKFKKTIEELFNVSKWVNDPIYKTQIDPIEKALKLYQPTTSILSMVTLEGTIKEYKSYEDIFDDWFDIRKSFYKKRVERSIIKDEARLVMLKNIHRFLIEIDVDDLKVTKVEQIKYLESKGYMKLDASKIGNTTHIFNNDDVNKWIFDEKTNKDVSYEYLLGIKVGKFSKSAVEKIRKSIEELEAKIAADKKIEWKYFVGDKLWVEDLNKFVKVLQVGLETNWTFKTKKKNMNQ
jgi:DNA topoisomerase II